MSLILLLELVWSIAMCRLPYALGDAAESRSDDLTLLWLGSSTSRAEQISTAFTRDWLHLFGFRTTGTARTDLAIGACISDTSPGRASALNDSQYHYCETIIINGTFL